MRRFAAFGLTLVAAFALVLLATVGWMRLAPRQVPAGQPPLATLDAGALPAFKAAFDASAGEVRVLVLLSPT